MSTVAHASKRRNGVRVRKQRPLTDIAKDIQSEVEKIDGYQRSAVQHAINAGRLLRKAKRQVGHGKWMEWLEAEFPGDPTTAADYMRLARHAQEIGDAPSIRSALKQLPSKRRAPKKARAEPASANGSSGSARSAKLVSGSYADLNADQTEALRDAAEPLWCALAELGWVDAYGGAQFRRVLPAAIEFIRQEANIPPSEDK